MNYVLEKSNKKVVWINPDPNKLTGVDVWGNFDPTQHDIAYALHYNPQIGDEFKAEVVEGVAQEFVPKTVYNKITCAERALLNWEDVINSDTETEDEPLKDSSGNLVPNQIYTPKGWEMDVEKLLLQITSKVNGICATKIISGFISTALGSPHLYSSDQDDQLNLIGLVSLNEIVMYKCTDQKGVKEYRAHTAEQIKRVLSDGAKRKTSLLQNAFSLKSELQTATTATKLLSIDIDAGWG
ncbi:hypothetical protein DQM68_19505 (plasmid) [Leptospira mayottensis]|uniref:Uncharacterized protein n=1 Tax=Leptospira mayottensis 200901116 TaxID=1192864 RepID=A0A343URX3_9LEPT|nr:hypothetical protein [Leptospira mayottensis]AVH81546.1 hypothetical protein [Leptospira mayottensis 200901116]AXR62883.1 hypothetical protein DQM68_19505 [Leptospira mayottensis]TGN00380.1 hypothetical protein EHR03_13215 [Leptospira mayottensis]